jgi:predicted nucleotide-binding protein (sugar kinase/HSP70/actin superfamily)
MMDISLRATVNTYLAFMFGGLLRRVGCKIRPYETVKGMTEKVMEEGLHILDGAFEGLRSKEDALKEVTSLFEKIPRRVEKRPQVAIFGDGYVRDNDFTNQGLIRFIEEQGGEVITTPDNSFLKMISSPYVKKWFIEGEYLFSILSMACFTTLKLIERKYYRYFEPLLNEPIHEYRDSTQKILAGYNLLPEHTGESMENIIKSHYIKKYHPDVSLFVHTSPAFCCPALVTDALAKKIEETTGVPMVNITYDGTCSAKNSAVIPYLAFSNKDAKRHVHDMDRIERFLGK